MCRELRVRTPGSHKGIPDSPACGVYLEDVSRFCNVHRIAGQAVIRKSRRDFSRLKKIVLRSPVMVEMGGDPQRWGLYGHWIVLRGAADGKWHYLDPGYKRVSGRFARSLTDEQFLRNWTGAMVFFKPVAA